VFNEVFHRPRGQPRPAGCVEVMIALQAVDGVLIEHGIALAQDLPKGRVVVEERFQAAMHGVHMPLPPVRALFRGIVPHQAGLDELGEGPFQLAEVMPSDAVEFITQLWDVERDLGAGRQGMQLRLEPGAKVGVIERAHGASGGHQSSVSTSASAQGHTSGNVASGKPVSFAAWRRARR
jgi:hypothetical protein